MSSEPIYLDSETAPIADVEAYYDEAAEAEIEAPSNYVKPEAIANYIEREKVRRRSQHVDKAAADPDLCRIVYLGAWWPGHTHPTLWECRDEDAEREALRAFWDGYHLGDVVCGFNSRAFDLAVMYRRSLYLHVPTKPIERDRYRSPNVLDLFELLNEGRKDRMRSLDWYCRRFGLFVPQDDIDGSQVPALVAAGEWDKVRAHLLADLMRTRALARRVVPSIREVAV